MTSTADIFKTLDLVPGDILVADDRGIIQYVNAHGLKMSGYQPDEMIGSPLSSFWKQSSKRSENILRHLADKRLWQGEIRHLHKDGTWHWGITSLCYIPAEETDSPLIIQNSQPMEATTLEKIKKLEKDRRILKEKAGLYRMILDASPDPISLTRLEDGKYIDVNKAFHKHTGFTPEQIARHTAVELNVYTEKDQRNRLISRLRKDGHIENMAMTIKTRKGTFANDLWSMRVIKYKKEDHLLLVSRNYNQLKKTQMALEESEASYRRILEAAPFSIVISRLSDAHYMQVNKAFCTRTGYTPEEVIGRTPHELGIFVDINDQIKLRQIFAEKGRVDNMEVKFRAKDGTVLENLLSTTPITYKGEACLLTITVYIGELKATQRALKESEERYRNILKNMEEGYWEMDLNGIFTFANEAECRIHHRTKEEMIGLDSKQNTNPETAEKIKNLFKKVYKTGQPAPIYAVEINLPDNTSTFIESSASLLRDSRGNPVGFFGISRDVSEKIKIEKELEKHRKNLEQMVRERTLALEKAQEELIKREKLSVLGQLTATVSHELRNPLGVIRSSSFYLQRKMEQADEKIVKHIKRIDEQVAICDGIVADLLEYTRGRNVIPKTVPLLPWLKTLIEEIEDTKDIRIKRNLPDALPDIFHDQEKMRRVFINLLENAIYATQDLAESKKKSGLAFDPEISLTMKLEDQQLVITISDNGTGMDKKTLTKAFEPLFTTRARGTGIGLANVLRIINDHNGKITLESRPGHGTTATITLPV